MKQPQGKGDGPTDKNREYSALVFAVCTAALLLLGLGMAVCKIIDFLRKTA